MAPNVAEHPSAEEDRAPTSPAPAALGAMMGKRATKAAHQKIKAEVLPNDKTAPFTLADLKNAIPAHCFAPTLHESFFHLAVDLAQVVAAAALVLTLDPFVADVPLLRFALWAAYWVYQGITLTGVWVIAHECGHDAFSAYHVINDVTGFILHTCLYVPYFAWRRSHSNHHHFTNNLARDEVFVPAIHDGASPVPSKNRNPILVAGHLLGVLIFGWPLYLIANHTSHPSDSFNNHFLPDSNIFVPKDRIKVMLSTIGLIAWTLALFAIGNHYGHLLVLALYLPPLLIVNGFLVAITFLQHTDLKLPHYDESEWTWLRGALCTVDRTMGRFLDTKLHFIHNTHMCHHIFSKVPFYRSEEATRAMIPVLGKYYNKNTNSFALTLFRNFRDCNYLENKKGILYWVEENLG